MYKRQWSVQKQRAEEFIYENLIEPDTISSYKGEYFIEVNTENSYAGAIESMRFELSDHRLHQLMTSDNGRGLTAYGIGLHNPETRETLEIKFYSPVDTCFYLEYANYYFSDPWKGKAGINVEYYVSTNNPDNPDSFYRYLGSNTEDSSFEINYIGEEHLNGTFKTRWEECCGGRMVHDIEGELSIPIKFIYGVKKWQDRDK